MIIFKCNINDGFNINKINIKLNNDSNEYDYEIIGKYDVNKVILYCLQCVFINPDKKYILKWKNFEIKPNVNDEINELGIINMESEKIIKYCKYEKNIISYCLYGNKELYNLGAIENAKTFKQKYPDSVCYFYIRGDVDKNILNKLKEYDAKIIKCVYLPGYLFRLTRFLASENIEGYYMCRDVDCRLTERDIISNNEWLNSNYKYHIVRDHPGHFMSILAGLWGCKKNVNSDIRFKMAKFMYEKKMSYVTQSDQQFLHYNIYPLVKNNVLEHDEFNSFVKGTKIKHNRKNNEYIGEAYDENNKILDISLRYVN